MFLRLQRRGIELEETSDHDDAWGITTKHILRTQDIQTYKKGHNSAKNNENIFFLNAKVSFRRSKEVY